MVKQGTVREDAHYINGSPSHDNIDIEPEIFYTLVYFLNLDKSASVNGGPMETGEADAMIEIFEGDTVKYKIHVIAGKTPRETYTISDTIPAGMTLVTNEGSYTPDMTWTVDNGVTTVQWAEQTGIKDFFFTVKVDRFKRFTDHNLVNQAVLTTVTDSLTLFSNYTYHRANKAEGSGSVDIQVTKIIRNMSSYNMEAQAELATRPFFISLSGGANGSISLMHNESSPIMTIFLDSEPVIINVTELTPMEFDSGIISAVIIHSDGTQETLTGPEITVIPGDNIMITVTSAFIPKPFFKSRDWNRNIFDINNEGNGKK
jgi:uncharacterized repeat protein (TIGR01451 family)